MNDLKETLKTALEHTLPWVVLGILVFYTYAAFFQHPYGFSWETRDGIITKVFVNEREPTIHLGDKLLSVGATSLPSFYRDLRKSLFQGVLPGQLVPVTVQRGDQVLTIEWRLPGTNPGEQRDQLFSQWFLAYVFWLAGTFTLLVLRPRDERWALLAAFNYLTAIWLSASSGLSFFHILYSALVLRVALWLCIPVYLHLHWAFPRPLGKLPRAVVWTAYALAVSLAVLQWFQLVPEGLAFNVFSMAVLGSLALLVVHAVRQPDMRRDMRVLLLAAALAIFPFIGVAALAVIEGFMPPITWLALISLPMLPLAYLYAAYRRQLGGLELRVNRVITLYAFLLLLGGITVPVVVLINQLPRYSADQTLIAGIIVSILATALSLWGYPLFQRYIERRFLGIAVPSRELQQAYTSSITSSTSLSALTHLLSEEIMPSLLVRQFVFLVLDNGSTRVLQKTGVTDEQLPLTHARAMLMPLAGGNMARRSPADPRLSWIRLALPLRVQDNVFGFWLFGRRDPDDLYSAVEIPILQSFADQAAVALSNVLQTERLRAMYQADINRHENERLSLARDLHDSVLSELAGMLMNAEISSLPRSFQDGYRALTQRLREIVSDLRPPMLNYGLKPAIEELADNLMERTKDAVTVIVDLDSTDDRYPADKEQHLFRIVQEACENAVRHSNCRMVTVWGQLSAEVAELNIEDDGDGFQLPRQNTSLDDLLSQRHFGLAGMFERAELIHAEIRLASNPGAGTRICVTWRAA